MAKALEDALKRSLQSKEFQQAAESLKEHNVTIAKPADKILLHPAAENQQAANDNIQSRIEQANPEAQGKVNQAIEETRGRIDGASMQNANVLSFQQTPSNGRPRAYGLENKEIDAASADNIGRMEGHSENNRTGENAFHKALARKPGERTQEQQIQKEVER